MSDGPSKSYNPRETESRIYRKWLDANAFRATPDDRPRDRRFVMVIPPPNVTGALHLGHALNNTLQDILTRRKRMDGFNTLWLPGTDHAGIATQATVEKEIMKAEKKTRHDLGRDELVRRIWEWKERFGGRILEQLQLMGCSCDWTRLRFTLDDWCARAVRETFFKLFRDGLIYRGKRLVNWDTQLQTAVADDEVYHETVKGHLWHVRYPLTEPATLSGESGDRRIAYLVVATTRPETMLGDTAVAVHPEDPRYAPLIGRSVHLPLTGRTIPIIGDGLLVKREFGTGCVKVTPAHDPNDYQCALRNNLPMLNIMTPDGRINENGGAHQGLKLEDARKKVVADLDAEGLLERVEDYETDVGHSDRSKVPIQPYLSDQWFVRMGDLSPEHAARIPGLHGRPGLAQLAIDAVNEGRVRFHPERYAKTYLDWLGEKRDWCISRQLWWGHRIPVWSRAASSGDARAPSPGPPLAELVRAGQVAEQRFGDDPAAVRTCYCPRPEFEDRFRQVAEPAGFTQDSDVLDTWFSSALWPHSTLGWPEADPTLLAYYYPTSVLSTAREIITLWVARMVITGLYNVGDVPFRDVVIHAVIQDGHGRKMSKSLGNGVDPVDIIDAYGADALRYTLAESATETQDIRVPVKPTKLPDGRTVNTSERFEKGRNFCNKLWQVSTGFVIPSLGDAAFAPIERAALALEDRWILSRLSACVASVSDALDGYHFSDAAQALYQFMWNDYCDWYVEMIKPRLRAGGDSARIARQVLAHGLDRLLRLLHPLVPFVTEAIWEALAVAPRRGIETPHDAEPMLATARWPEREPAWRDDAVESDVEILKVIIRAIRDIRTRVNALRAGQPALRTLPAAVVRGGRRCCELLATQGSFVQLLAGCDRLDFGPNAAKPAGSMTSVHEAAQVFVPVGELVDLAAERARLASQLEAKREALDRERERLANESFTSRAAPDVVERARQREAELERQVADLRQHLADLG
ncbi:MAG: valine--tRNA ligase [Phycisphaerae bacterium]|nr:valine--tRNA ligase [Phycisphaerae bacterium]